MIVKALKKEWDVKDCSYKEARELHKLNALVWWDGKQDPEKYYELLERVEEISKLDLSKEKMTDIDQVLQKVFIAYLNLDPKESGD